MMVCASRHATPAVCCLGRLGDIAAALPIAHDLYYQTGAPTPFIVSQDYAPLLEACSYVSPIPVDLRFDRLGFATRKHIHRYGQIHIAQTFATDERMPERVTDSFVTDAWARAGVLERFGLPLVIDRRDKAREQKLIDDMGLSGRPYVVVHGGGVSSPYPHRHELLKALSGVPARVIDITALSAQKPQDLLAVLEGASCAILADSFPLHLSYALPNLPVIALATDKPDNWYGAPPRPNWIHDYRYEESREFLHLIGAQVEAVLSKPDHERFAFPAGAYNASLLDHGGKRLYTWRYHHRNTWETRLRGSNGAREFPILLPPEYDAYSHEDARLFLHRGKPHISLTLASSIGRDAKCHVVYGELHCGKSAWRVPNPTRIAYGSSTMEKNWVFWSQDGRLYCLYASQPEQIVLEVEGAKVIAEHRSPAPTWPYGDIRGDAIVPHDGKLTRIFHSTERYPSRKFRYFIGSALLEGNPPFHTLRVNQAPLCAGDERRDKTLHHSKPSVIFTCGAIKERGEFVVAISRDDDSAELQRFSERQLGI
jgi:hypothetical protein